MPRILAKDQGKLFKSIVDCTILLVQATIAFLTYTSRTLKRFWMDHFNSKRVLRHRLRTITRSRAGRTLLSSARQRRPKVGHRVRMGYYIEMTSFPFNDLHSFKDFVVFAQICSPDEYPQRDGVL